ncbi:MAG TPA: DinB family protein [Bryobacteraceae bacterium]|jgi:uncharacterized damage-inducible protein DinB
MRVLTAIISVLALTAASAFPQGDLKSLVLKHLKTSEDFTVKVAEAMPASDYDFKLTSPQMSFGQQMVHLSQGFDYILSPFYGEKPNPPKPKSTSKEDVIAFIKSSFDRAINRISSLTPEQISKTYTFEGYTESGQDLLLGVLDHITHHRASAEMYLRAKGITPPEYQF